LPRFRSVWRVNAASGSFTGTTGVGFRIKPVGIT
jgi:hypothetical protein